ncbi:Laminin subunit alpha-4 [Armadillidium vulgare]|nr:Laminin subunit alpha-4 [Armadillidium vulgare]
MFVQSRTRCFLWRRANLSCVVVRPKFHVGLKFEMYLEIKPRKNTGVIMSVHGRRDFILLQLRDGVIELKVDNGKGIIGTQFNLSNAYHICDGGWHSIQVLKNKHVIVLTVDGVHAPPASGPLGSSSADTNKPLFLGSQPRLSSRRGNAVSEKFVGCMRNVVVNSDKIDFSYILYVGEVNAGVCPTI